MKINIVIIAILVIAILALVYFVIKRNRKDQKELVNELNNRDIKPEKHEEDKV